MGPAGTNARFVCACWPVQIARMLVCARCTKLAQLRTCLCRRDFACAGRSNTPNAVCPRPIFSAFRTVSKITKQQARQAFPRPAHDATNKAYGRAQFKKYALSPGMKCAFQQMRRGNECSSRVATVLSKFSRMLGMYNDAAHVEKWDRAIHARFPSW